MPDLESISAARILSARDLAICVAKNSVGTQSTILLPLRSTGVRIETYVE